MSHARSSKGLSTPVLNQLLIHCSLKSRLSFNAESQLWIKFFCWHRTSRILSRLRRRLVSYLLIWQWHMILSGTVVLPASCWSFCRMSTWSEWSCICLFGSWTCPLQFPESLLMRRSSIVALYWKLEEPVSPGMPTLSAYLQTWRLKLSHIKTVTAVFHLITKRPNLSQMSMAAIGFFYFVQPLLILG